MPPKKGKKKYVDDEKEEISIYDDYDTESRDAW